MRMKLRSTLKAHMLMIEATNAYFTSPAARRALERTNEKGQIKVHMTRQRRQIGIEASLLVLVREKIYTTWGVRMYIGRVNSKINTMLSASMDFVQNRSSSRRLAPAEYPTRVISDKATALPGILE